ncbi:hypothetical protein HanRHA438_Chr01g0021651 [Helianthus annuus]|nr:hypothetical protein HanIR_Chr01g0022751 [Helianthus annuus]KAJ0947948.1 hypothetical protein HanRHA438_Chr01g0021651 [Helianthus annuus]
MNARYLSHVLKLLWRLRMQSIKRLLVDKEGEEMRQRAMEEIQENVKLAVSHGGWFFIE